jgi:hypothetical protein
LAVNAEDVAMPLEFVMSASVAAPLEKVPLAPVDGAKKTTETPTAGVPLEVTVATNALTNAVLTVALCPPPLVGVMAMIGAVPAVLVKAKLAGVGAPEVEAVTEYGPVVELAVNAEDVATPFPSVGSVSVAVPLAKVPLAPVDGAKKTTETPTAGDPLEVTVAESVPNEFRTTAVVVYPLTGVMAIVGGGVDVFVNAKLAGVVAAAVEAVTEYDPVVMLAVNTEEVATPIEFVVSVSVAVPLAKVPLAPDDGAVKVTEMPLAGEPFVVTVAESVPNAVPTIALAVYPLTAVMFVTGGGVMFEPDEPQLARKPTATQTSAKPEMRTKIFM